MLHIQSLPAFYQLVFTTDIYLPRSPYKAISGLEVFKCSPCVNFVSETAKNYQIVQLNKDMLCCSRVQPSLLGEAGNVDRSQKNGGN